MQASSITGGIGVGHELPHRQAPHLARDPAVRMQGEIAPARPDSSRAKPSESGLNWMQVEGWRSAARRDAPRQTPGGRGRTVWSSAAGGGPARQTGRRHFEVVLIQPGAAHRHRLMMQGDQGVALGMLAQRLIQRRQLVIPSTPWGLPRTWVSSRITCQCSPTSCLASLMPAACRYSVIRAVVVVAGQPVDGASKRRHHGGEPLIGLRAVILGKIPGGEDQIERWSLACTCSSTAARLCAVGTASSRPSALAKRWVSVICNRRTLPSCA